MRQRACRNAALLPPLLTGGFRTCAASPTTGLSSAAAQCPAGILQACLCQLVHAAHPRGGPSTGSEQGRWKELATKRCRTCTTIARQTFDNAWDSERAKFGCMPAARAAAKHAKPRGAQVMPGALSRVLGTKVRRGHPATCLRSAQRSNRRSLQGVFHTMVQNLPHHRSCGRQSGEQTGRGWIRTETSAHVVVKCQCWRGCL